MTRAPWLESVDLVGPGRSFPGRRLRYHPVVSESRVRLRLALPAAGVQQLLLEHRAEDRLLSREMMSVQGGRVEWPLELLRGWNRLRCAAPGEPDKVFLLDVLHRSGRREWAETLLYALVFALLIRTFLLQVFVLPEGTRLDPLQGGDRVLISRLHYQALFPGADEIVVVEHSPAGPSRFALRRTAGLPGQRVETAGTTVLVDGRPVRFSADSSAATTAATTALPSAMPPLTVPEGSFFLVGSNRTAAGGASLWWGFKDSREILGKAVALIWPWERRRLLQ